MPTRKICTLRNSLIILSACLTLFSFGCSTMGPIPHADVPKSYVPPIEPENAYITIGIEIGEGNLEEIRFTLLTLDKSEKKAYIAHRGIFLPGTKDIRRKLDIKQPNMVRDTLTKVKDTGADRHAYLTFVLNKDQLSEGGKSLLFFSTASRAMNPGGPSTSNKELRISSVHYHYFGFGFLDGGYDPLKPVRAAIAPMEYMQFVWTKEQHENKELWANEPFKGNLFVVDKPGFYYLGDFKVSGNIIYNLAEDDGRFKLHHIIGDFTVDVTNDIARAEAFLKENAGVTTEIKDLSKGVKDIPLYDYVKFKEGELDDDAFFRIDNTKK